MSSQGLEFFGAQDTPDIRSLDTIAAIQNASVRGLIALSRGLYSLGSLGLCRK